MSRHNPRVPSQDRSALWEVSLATREMKQNAKTAGSNQMIAHAIADRVLLQMQSGKSQQAVISDLGKTKEALKLAQKAFYEKDPEAIELLQLGESDKSVVDVSDKIFLFDNSSQ